MTGPASDPNNPANWLSAGFPDGSSLTFDQLNPLPSLSPIGSGVSPIQSGILSQGGAPATGGTPGTSIASNVAPSNPNAPRITVNPIAGPSTGSISDYFLRGIIVILGFIFVAVGLNMFRPGIVPDPRNIPRPGAAS